MCEFKPGDKAEFNENGTERLVIILSNAMYSAAGGAETGHIYLVGHVNTDPTRPRFMTNERFLRRAEQWEPCPGPHRVMGFPDGAKSFNMERLVE